MAVRKPKKPRQFERDLERRTERIETLYVRYAKEDNYDANAYAYLHMTLKWRRLMQIHRRTTRTSALCFYLYLLLVGPFIIVQPNLFSTIIFVLFSIGLYYRYQHFREDEKDSQTYAPTLMLFETTEDATSRLAKQLDKRYLEVYGED